MRIIVFFTMSIVFWVSPVFAQSDPVQVTPITNGFTISFTLPTYTLRDTSVIEFFNTSEVFKYIDVDDFGIIYDHGYPQLPQFSFDLHVPYDAYDFAVSCTHQTTQANNLNRRVLPTQKDFDKDSLPQLTFELNQSYYTSNGSLYNFTNQLSEPFIVFGEQGITMSIFPFLYNPQANSLTVVQQATFTVTYSMPRGGNGGTRASTDSLSQVKQDYLSSFFINYEPTRAGSTFGGKYLMITDPYLETTLSSFAPSCRICNSAVMSISIFNA